MRLSQALSFLVKPRNEGNGSHTYSVEFTFAITNDYPDRIIETNNRLFRLVGKKSQQSVYSVQALELSSSDINAASVIKATIIDQLIRENTQPTFSEESIEKVKNMALSMLNANNPDRNNTLLAYMVAHDTIGYGPISMLLDDRQNIEEIVINAPTSNIGIYHSTYGFCSTNLRFTSEKAFRYIMNKMIAHTERELGSENPIIDAELYDGSRLHAQLRPYSISGAAASIRLSGGKSMDIRRLMELGTASPELLAYIWLAIETNHNIIISGAPASGKTSFLLAVNAFVPRYQRVITIEEDVNELKFYSNFMNSISLQGSTIAGKTNVRDQVINALHLRPDRLIVGEIRGKEANEMMSGANLGVPFMTTMHSSGNGKAVIGRLQTKPMTVELQTLSMLDISIFMNQSGLTSRKVESLVEYKWLCRNEVKVEELGESGDPSMLEIGKEAKLKESSLNSSKVINEYSKSHLLSLAAGKKELANRAAFLKSMLAVENIASVQKYMESYGEIK